MNFSGRTMKMKLYKIIKAVAAAAALVGIFFIFGSVGTLDYYTEAGMNYPIAEALKTAVLGVVLLIPITIIAFNERGD